MSITLTGDFRALARFANSLENADRVMPKISATVAEEMRNMTLTSFASNAGPNDVMWQGRKSGGGSKLLVKTGAMRGSLKASNSRTTATIAYGTGYAQFHNTGTSRMVQRLLVPKGTIPPKWIAAFNTVVADALEEILG